ncbi:MAG: glutamate--tRNA ligase [Alphaproteobacteria bacterium]|nr:glutamate--tRNA ligase [Alphaproteobacteria bacterium]
MTEAKPPVLRFPPSPTGYLHIGGARTALFNWLYARHTGGSLLLRIEDTDRERSTPEAVAAIFEGLEWLELKWDGQTTYQSARADRHREVAASLLNSNRAYRCFATPAELDEMRSRQRAEGKPQRYDGRWRDRDPSQAPAGAPFVVRLKVDQEGDTVVHDAVLGEVRFRNDQLDDMILLRSDGTPTYMLAVVVDDHDSGVTHVLRGADHLNNTPRQLQILRALGWPEPVYGHVPLIHGPDGAKLSKRHGAMAIGAYRDMGYLPETIRNYLLRLGWSHGNDEIISTQQAIAWFNLENIQKSPARMDFKKLDNLNGHYIRASTDERLLEEVENLLSRADPPQKLGPSALSRLKQAMPSLKERSKTLVEIIGSAEFLFTDGPRTLDVAAEAMLSESARVVLRSASEVFAATAWEESALEAAARAIADEGSLKLAQVAQPVRAALTGKTVSPPIFKMMQILGREESLVRITAYAT